MRPLGKLCETLSKWTSEKEKDLIEAQRNTAEKIWEDVINLAPMRDGTYISSIQISDTIKNDESIKTKIYTDLLVGGSDLKWSKVPLGALLEWGTGIEGLSTNTYSHVYSYRLTPWCYYDEKSNRWVTTTGMIARPHFQPALLKNKEFYLQEIRKALKK